MRRDMVRLEAARSLAEAFGVGAPPAQPSQGAAPLPPSLSPQGGAPQGALSMGGGPMPEQRPAMSPLQAVPSFKSPPVQAALQGGEGIKGHPAMTKPVGFARGGFVVRGI